MIKQWDDMEYWRTGEWDVIQEKLGEEEKQYGYLPERENLFSALDATPFERAKVAIFGQDPYPSPQNATGIAFSIPDRTTPYPATLYSIFQEYSQDLGLPTPRSGNLERWCNQGVLLWNVIPSVRQGKPLSHAEWLEWFPLTQEIVQSLSDKGEVVFVFMGSVARDYAKYVNHWQNHIILTSHPSPRGSLRSKVPFVGSRVFSRINDALVGYKQTPIDWRLP